MLLSNAYAVCTHAAR